jgi:hypothetical protein
MSGSRRAVLVGAVLVLLSMIMARPAAAIPPGGLQCLKSMGGSLSVTPSTITAGQFVTLDPGIGADCHGAQHLDATKFDLAGHRASVGSDGSSTYGFSGQFAFETSVLGASVHVVVDVSINGATLAADNQAFAGTADVLIKPSIGDDCRKSWPFTTTRVPDVSVPSVLEMTLAQARSTLVAAGLRVAVSSAIDRSCGTLPGRIMNQAPDAETLVQPGSVVKVVTAIRPPVCP